MKDNLTLPSTKDFDQQLADIRKDHERVLKMLLEVPPLPKFEPDMTEVNACLRRAEEHRIKAEEYRAKAAKWRRASNIFGAVSSCLLCVATIITITTRR